MYCTELIHNKLRLTKLVLTAMSVRLCMSLIFLLGCYRFLLQPLQPLQPLFCRLTANRQGPLVFIIFAS